MGDKSLVTSILAYAYTVIFALVLGALMFGNVPAANEKYFLLLLGSLVGFVGAGIQFFFGSSVSSAAKDATIEALTPPKSDTTTTVTVVSDPPTPAKPAGPSPPAPPGG